MPASNLKPLRFSSSVHSSVIFVLGLLHLDFNQFLGHEETIYPLYFPLFHSQYASHGHLLKEWFLTVEYQECLKAGPFDVHYQCISAWWDCDCSTRMRCVDTFCWHLSLICLYREDAWNVPVSSFSLDVVIFSSLNDSVHNILNDVLKIIYGLVGSLLFNGFTFSVFDGFLVSVILSSVVSPTGGMVMCVTVNVWFILRWPCMVDGM